MSIPSVRRLAKRLSDQRPAQAFRLVLTTVTSVSAGGSADGVASVFFADGADHITAAHVTGDDDWTPTVGQPIAVLMVDGSPLILGRRAGFPNI